MLVKKRCLLAALLFILLASPARAQEKNVVYFDSLTDEAAEAEALIDLAQQDISDPYLHALLASDGETLLLLDTQARTLYARPRLFGQCPQGSKQTHWG